MAKNKAEPTQYRYGWSGDKSEMETSYFGEVTIHFKTPGSLCLPVTVAQANRVLTDLDSSTFLIAVTTLDNRRVYIRRAAIEDIYISDEAADTFGPEASGYDDWLGFMPDDHVWEIAEQIATDDSDLTEEDIELFDNYVAERCGVPEPPHLSHMRGQNDSREHISNRRVAVCNRARRVFWKTTSGRMRSESVAFTETVVPDIAEHLDEICETIDEQYDYAGKYTVPITIAEGAQTAVVMLANMDYIYVPLHKC